MKIQNSNRKLILYIRSIVTSCTFLFFTVNSTAQLSHSGGQIPVGNSDTNGFARIDKNIYSLSYDLYKGIDIFFKFSTDPRNEPKYIGAYWTIPFFDSHVTKTSSNKYRWIAPNLRDYNFNKLPKPDRGYEETYILNTTRMLKLNVSRNGNIVIENINNPENNFVFRNGRLISFCVGKDSHKFRLFYNGSGNPQSLYCGNMAVIKFDYNKYELVSEIIFPQDKKSVSITYDECNTFAEDGKTKQGKLFKAISAIIFSDGRKEEYKYIASENKTSRKVLSGEKETVINVSTNRLNQYINKDNKGFIEWDASTGIIISDSCGIYSIDNRLFDMYNPKSDRKTHWQKESRTQESRISYKKPEYKYPEIWDYSTKTVIKMTQNPHTGERIRTYYIGIPGNTSMKVRKIERKLSNGKEWEMQTVKAYNDKGDLIREIDGNDNLREYIYDKNGIHWKTLNNGNLTYMAYNDNQEDSIRSIEEIGDGNILKVVRKSDGILEIQQTVDNEIKSKMIFNKKDNSLSIGMLKIFIEKQITK